MKCPVCTDITLLMTERQGVEIDYCPSCRGVWLDRGELDKLIGAQATHSSGAPMAAPMTAPKHHTSEYEHHRGHEDRESHQSYSGQRKKSWLQEIFD